ncbi:MAG: formylglycine-generating enzyme family protein [Kiritimatiellae bacterium]|nr:formylglycine-generating enzyme family protein [Kiritimatiellia bacterium]
MKPTILAMRGARLSAALCAGTAIIAAMSPAMLCATPVIPEESVSISQDASHVVRVGYTLGEGDNEEAAIVTVDFETNVTGTAEGPWASIGSANFRNVGGDVNKVVLPGARTIVWRPNRDWPDRYITGGNFRARVKAWAKTCPPDYMVCDLAIPGARYFYTDADALPGGIESDEYRKDMLLMRKIPAANVTWRMGSPENEKGRDAGYTNEVTHLVTLKSDYYIGVFPVTRWQHSRIYGESVANVVNPCNPRTGISYNGLRYGASSQSAHGLNGGVWPLDTTVAVGSTMHKLREITGLPTFDLPTSAQWEFACRAGTSSALNSGKELLATGTGADANLMEIAWYAYNSPAVGEPLSVGQKKPNNWGLYDMIGLVHELCLDWYCIFTHDSTMDPEVGAADGQVRFARGGARNSAAAACRSAYSTKSTAPSETYVRSGTDLEILGYRVKCSAVIP